MQYLAGQVSLGIGFVLLFFALVKAEFFLWSADATTSNINFNPIPFLIGSAFFFILAVPILKHAHEKAKKNQIEQI